MEEAKIEVWVVLLEAIAVGWIVLSLENCFDTIKNGDDRKVE